MKYEGRVIALDESVRKHKACAWSLRTYVSIFLLRGDSAHAPRGVLAVMWWAGARLWSTLRGVSTSEGAPRASAGSLAGRKMTLLSCRDPHFPEKRPHCLFPNLHASPGRMLRGVSRDSPRVWLPRHQRAGCGSDSVHRDGALPGGKLYSQ